MSKRDSGGAFWTAGYFRTAGALAWQALLLAATIVMVLYFTPSVQGIQAPLLALALEDRAVHLVFEGGTASPLHGRLGVARPKLLDDEDREILKAELIEIDGAGWRGGGPAVRSVLLKKPEVNVFLCPDGSLSLMYLLKEKRRKRREKGKGTWKVESLRVEEGRITVDLPLLTGHLGPLRLTGNIGKNKGVSRGAVHLRIETIALELRGPTAAVSMLTALGWTPERLSSLGPVEVRASWDGDRFSVEEALLRARPLELSLQGRADHKALSLDMSASGTWEGEDLLEFRGSLGPRPPLGHPGYDGTLRFEGIDLAALRGTVEVPSIVERFMSGRLEGEVVFAGSLEEPERLTLARCHFGVVGGAAPLGIRCPEGGTTIDPTRFPEVGPMTFFKKEIPWGEGRLLLGAPEKEAAP